MGKLRDMALGNQASQPAVEAPAIKAEAPKPEAKPIQVKDKSGRRWWMAGGGVVLIFLGFIGFVQFAGSQNMVYGAGGIFAIITGGFGIFYGIKKQEGGMVVIQPGQDGAKKKVQVIANSLNIYPGTNGLMGTVVFENLSGDQLLGFPRKCKNDSKYYHVNIHDSAWNNPKSEGKLIPFSLPDTQYRDTKVFALNLRIPAHRKLALRKATLLEKLSPVLLLVAIVVVGIIWVALTPTPGAK